MGIFGYLSEFWSSITETTVTAGVYTVDFFKSIGNAVAGALGNIFLQPIKLFVDLALAIGYIFSALFSVVTLIFGLFKFLTELTINIAKVLIVSPFTAPQFEFNNQFLVFFKAYPQINTLLLILGVLIVFIGMFTLIREIAKNT